MSVASYSIFWGTFQGSVALDARLRSKIDHPTPGSFPLGRAQKIRGTSPKQPTSHNNIPQAMRASTFCVAAVFGHLWR
jgi:hypothetical protein